MVILEFLVGLFQEALPQLLKYFGACIKWIFNFGKKPFKGLLQEEWNTRIGLFVFVLIIVITLNLTKSN